MSTLDNNFVNFLTSLTSYAKALYNKLLAGKGSWVTFNNENISKEEIEKLFNRDNTSKNYISAISGEESYKEAQIAKLQGDSLSAAGREVRARYMSRCEIFSAGVAKAKSHSSAIGPFNTVFLYLTKLIHYEKD